MIAELANHLWQSTVFALAVAVVTIAFRRHQARVRFALWLCASAKFCVPFTLLIAAGGWVTWPAGAPAMPRSVSTAVMQASAPFVLIATGRRGRVYSAVGNIGNRWSSEE